jgi:type IV secretory pathway VirJ component
MPSPRARLLPCAVAFFLLAGTAGSQPTGRRPLTSQSPTGPPAARTWDEQPLTLPLVGRATAYVPRAATPHVVLFISGDGGWNAGVIDMARRIAAQPAVVVGISYPALRRGSAREGGCWYVASDLELISHAAQRALNLPQYHAPILVGYSSGASLVYAALANTPAVTFAGGIGFGFCPEIQAPRDICAGDAWSPEYDEGKHLNHLPPTKVLPKDWYILQGVQDQVCPIDTIRRFLAGMPRAHLLEIDGTGHGFSKPQHWGAPFDQALQDLWTEKEVEPPAAQPRSATTRELEGELQRLQLPLEFRWPAQLTALLLFFSGDGGWATLDEDVAEQLVSRNIGVVGISSLRYFWTAKPPAQVGTDIRRLLATVAASRRPVFIGGFSFGAEVVPVALQEIATRDRQSVAGLVLVGPGPSASFEIDPLDWIRKPAENPATRVAPAVRSLGLPALCLAGMQEDETPCPSLAGVPGVQVARLPGSHHFNGDYPAVAETVSQFIRRASVDKRH